MGVLTTQLLYTVSAVIPQESWTKIPQRPLKAKKVMPKACHQILPKWTFLSSKEPQISKSLRFLYVSGDSLFIYLIRLLRTQVSLISGRTRQREKKKGLNFTQRCKLPNCFKS